MQTETQDYLSSVLGIQNWIRPPVSEGSARAAKTLVYTPFQMSEAEINMAKKMIAAAQLSEPVFLTQESLSAKLQNHTETNFAAAIAFGVSAKTEVDTKWLELPAISKFLDHENENQLAQLKKKSWDSLQKFKLALETI